MQAFEAAALGAYLHGRAGELAALELGSTASVMAGDVGEALIHAVAELQPIGKADLA
jgi:NAD(P)H-hydrate repair Nnr-like enzyme with NAD(P)H-hydrate dehydratase domain